MPKGLYMISFLSKTVKISILLLSAIGSAACHGGESTGNTYSSQIQNTNNSSALPVSLAEGNIQAYDKIQGKQALSNNAGKKESEKICGIIPMPENAGMEHGMKKFSSGKYIAQEMTAAGAETSLQPARPSKKIMKRPPTFAPRTKINISAKFSCGGKAENYILLIAPYSEKMEQAALLMKAAKNFVCGNNNTGLIAVFADLKQENYAAEAAIKQYGKQIKCFSSGDFSKSIEFPFDKENEAKMAEIENFLSESMPEENIN